MKFFFAALVMISASGANAAVFRKTSVLPKALQQRVLAAIQASCLSAALSEDSTEVKSVREDQGVVDHFYTTTLTATVMFDEHPVYSKIYVKSAEYAISNPAVDRHEVLDVQGTGDICR